MVCVTVDAREYQKMDMETLAKDVRIYIFRQAVETAVVPQPEQIAQEFGLSREQIDEVLKYLAASKVLILAPQSGRIWAANPFSAVPSCFRVTSDGEKYWGICIWDALGVAAAVGKDALIDATCGDCGEPMHLELRNGQ